LTADAAADPAWWLDLVMTDVMAATYCGRVATRNANDADFRTGALEGFDLLTGRWLAAAGQNEKEA
jgi:hypothetical protein